MTSGRIKRSFSKSAVIAAGEYARCRQLVFMPRIKFPFFFFHPLPARLSAAHAARYFRATPSDSRVFDCSSIPPFAISLSFSFRFPFSVRTSTGRVFAIVRFFYIYIYIKRNILPRCLHFERSSFYDVRLQTTSFGYSAISKLYFRESFWTDDHRRTCKKRRRGKRSFNVVDRGCKNGAADALETPEFGSVSGLVEIRAGRRCS